MSENTSQNTLETQSDSGLMLSQNSAQYFNPDAPPLNKEQLANAVEDLLIKIPKKPVGDYPRLVRSYVDPPVQGQNFANVSMMFFPQPQITQNGKNLYGFGKVSFVSATEDGAGDDAARLIRNVNSHNHIFMVPVGHLFPLTNDEHYARQIQNVSEDKENDKKTEELIKKAHDEEEKIKRQIKEREEDAKNVDYDDKESVNYYTKARVSRMELSRYITNGELKMQELSKKLKEKDVEIRSLNKSHPSFTNEWVSVYNTERVKAGMDVFLEETNKEHNYSSQKSGKEEEE